MLNRHGLLQDIGIRIGGLVIGAVGTAAMMMLYRLVNAPPRHEAKLVEILIGIAGFMSTSAGVTLLALGRHIFDRIEISARWATQPVHPPQPNRTAETGQGGAAAMLVHTPMHVSLSSNVR